MTFDYPKLREDTGPLIGGQKKGYLMINDSSRSARDARNAVMAIGVGGLTAGTLDIAQALTLFGKNVPLAIAAGLLGPQAFRGGIGTYILGVLLHFFIALSVATIYFAASRQLRF